jgi:hypothetical protein
MEVHEYEPHSPKSTRYNKTWHSYLHLPYTYNFRNSIHLQAIEMNKDMRLWFFDTETLYTNILNTVVENIQEIDRNIQKETIHILKTVMEQNYLQVEL